MNSAAIVNTHRPPLTIVQRVATAMRDEDLSGWRSEVEAFITAIGERPNLSHVTAERWEHHFFAGEDPQDAVVAELDKLIE